MQITSFKDLYIAELQELTSLEEEKEADAELTKLAKSEVNRDAVAA